MIFRARLDFGWSDVGHAVLSCVLPGRGRGALASIERAFPAPAGDTTAPPLVCLSVRSGFDLLLETLALPPGSEVLLTAVTIPDMARIIRAHGLVPVPVDVATDTLEPDLATLEKARSPRSRVLLVAHLFGAVSDFSAAREFARRHGLLFVEDCAQSYLPGRFIGDPGSDVRMLSFGPIKTNTAFGGGILFLRDAALRARMAKRLAALPVQPRLAYLVRALKYSLVTRMLGVRAAFAAYRAVFAAVGKDFDDVVRQAARGFPGDDFFDRIRRRPGAPLLRMMARRVGRENPRMDVRAAAGNALAAGLPPQIERPGAGLAAHTHWIFPVLVPDPAAAIRHLRQHGFDATVGASSLTAVAVPLERPDIRAPNADYIMAHILFVPAYPEMRAADRNRLADAIAALAPHPGTAAASAPPPPRRSTPRERRIPA